MLKGDGNENSNKIITSNEHKNKFACAANLQQICLYIFCHCFAWLQCRFARLKRETS